MNISKMDKDKITINFKHKELTILTATVLLAKEAKVIQKNKNMGGDFIKATNKLYTYFERIKDELIEKKDLEEDFIVFTVADFAVLDTIRHYIKRTEQPDLGSGLSKYIDCLLTTWESITEKYHEYLEGYYNAGI